MHSRNDAPHHHNSGDGCGVEGRYVPFSSSGGARPLPYPFGLCGKNSRCCRRDGGNVGNGNIEDLIKRAVQEALKATTAARTPPPPSHLANTPNSIGYSPATAVEPDAPRPSPTDQHLADELAQGLKRKRGERHTGGRGRRNLEILLKVLGDEKAVLTLIQLKGGNLFTVPKGENAQGKKRIQQLEEALGKEATQKFITYAGGTTFYIPRAAYLETDIRNREMCLERDRIAKEYPDMPERKIVETLAL